MRSPVSTAQKMGAPAGFHANPVDCPVCGEAQQLRTREVLANDDFTAVAQTHQMKLVFPKSMPIVCIFMECLLHSIFFAKTARA